MKEKKFEFREVGGETTLVLLGVTPKEIEGNDNVYLPIPEIAKDGAIAIFRMNLEEGHVYVFPRDYYAMVSSQTYSWEVQIPIPAVTRSRFHGFQGKRR